jgi:hypothetical protein
MTTPPRPPPEDSPGNGRAAKDARSRAVWEWASDTARLVALTASEVLRKLEHKGLSLEDDPKGSPSKPKGGTGGGGAGGGGGGGFNPYDRTLPARGARTPTAPRSAGAPRKAASARSPGSAPARSSWWRRLFGRG